ncbi:MAG: glycosyltransferase family 4 protein [Roseburia sp.]|nr:glycosyltransferase family 4 protein [Roseburia sp.]
MRIVFMLNSSGLYGANRSLLGLIQYLCGKGVKCFAIIPSPGEIEQEFKKLQIDYKMIVHRACVWYPGYIGAPFLVNLVKLPIIMRTIKKWNVDIIHTNNSNFDIGMIAALIMRKKHVWHVREVIEISYSAKYIFPRIYKKLREKSDAVICISKYTYDYSMSHYPNRNMKMIYNPCDIEYYSISRERFAPNETVTIIMAGIFVACKRQFDSVRAINSLVGRGIANIKLILAGNGEQQYIDEVEEYIRTNHLEQKVTLVGFVEDLREIRKESDIALCCTEGEALGRVVIEGMLSELLVIGANSGGIAELIENRERGLLYELGDYEQLADQIEYAINHKEECRQMILNAKKYAVENFELARSGESVLGVYKELLAD